MNQKTVIILGGGASGVLASLELLKANSARLEIFIIDSDQNLGRGRAYAEESSEDLLNVPAARMSGDASIPTDFIDYLEKKHSLLGSFPYSPFVPRTIYGEYLQSKIKPALDSSQVKWVPKKAMSIEAADSAYLVHFDDGSFLKGDELILASGYTKNTKTLFHENTKNEVLILGTGMSALDFWRRERVLATQKITFYSRHGFFPLPHLKTHQEITLENLSGMSPLKIFRLLRDEQKKHSASWQDVADAVRKQVQKIWPAWSHSEKAQFMRHLKPYWEIIRHRMPALVLQELQADLQNGRVEVLSRKKGETLPLFQNFARVHTASGAKIDQSLEIKNIPELKYCPWGFGYENTGAQNLWLIGPASKAALFEATAIPEIREQAKMIAKAILQNT